jgi:signal recognition particle subunit SRP54
MFQNLSEKLQSTLNKLRGKGKLTEKDVDAALREVRMALLEADVNFKVVKGFVETLRARCVGHEVMKSLTPGQQVVKIVYEELTNLMGTENTGLQIAQLPPTVIMLVGLQGSGKTTTGGKLARRLKSEGKSPLLVACDIYRPAAVKQLQVIGEQIGVPVFTMGTGTKPEDIAKAGRDHAISNGYNFVILDTAGRLHIDEDMMGELIRVKDRVKPTEILLVVDAMTGQDAVNVAKDFDERIGITGIILTKFDSDTRGGSALSVRSVTGKPIKYIGIGEKLDAFEPFHPERVAQRILGMGDVLTLIEKAEAAMDMEKAEAMAKKVMKGEDFTLQDFLDQLKEVKKLGSYEDVLSMFPEMPGMKGAANLQVDEKAFLRMEAVINSMTPQERANPGIIKYSRKQRIARGSGTKIQDVNRLLKQFEEVKKLTRQMSAMTNPRSKKGKGLFPFFK